MARISLNIGSKRDRNQVEKVYTADSYDLMFGTVEDLIELFDVDKMTDNAAIASLVVTGFNKIKPFIKDIFHDVTDDELKRVKVKELIPTFIQIFKSVIEGLDLIKTGN